jgi:hypothetical protein
MLLHMPVIRLSALRRLVPFLVLPWLLVSFAARTEEVLPKPEEPFQGTIGKTREESTPAWPTAVRPKKGAPNIVLILLDDVGFGAAGTFGGAATTPELDKLAAQGLRYNEFHTTGICSPTRAALLTGRNHHQVGFGNLDDIPAGFPAYNTIWKKSTASIAEVLRLNGYSTAAFGKWHNTPIWEISPVGPFDHWPTSLGFEYYYGFLAGETSEWEPRLYRDTVPVEHAPDPKYYLTTDLVDDAIHWIHQHDAIAPQKPFFVYFATGATHAPHHVPKEWIDKYKGRFDEGWDKLREEVFARQKKLGVIPANALLTPRPDGLGFAHARPEEALCAPDGSLRRLPFGDGLRGRPALKRSAGQRRCPTHVGALYRRRQWRQRRRRPRWFRRQCRDHRRRASLCLRNDRAFLRSRQCELRQPLRRRMVLGDFDALPMDEADRLAFRRHA